MVQKVTRKQSVAKRRVQKATKTGAALVDRRLLAQAERETLGLPPGVVPDVPPPTRGSLGPRVVHMGECREMVSQLNEAIDNVLSLAELADEHPYNEIALETLLSLRQMRDLIRLEMGQVQP